MKRVNEAKMTPGSSHQWLCLCWTILGSFEILDELSAVKSAQCMHRPVHPVLQGCQNGHDKKKGNQGHDNFVVRGQKNEYNALDLLEIAAKSRAPYVFTYFTEELQLVSFLSVHVQFLPLDAKIFCH